MVFNAMYFTGNSVGLKKEQHHQHQQQQQPQHQTHVPQTQFCTTKARHPDSEPKVLTSECGGDSITSTKLSVSIDQAKLINVTDHKSSNYNYKFIRQHDKNNITNTNSTTIATLIGSTKGTVAAKCKNTPLISITATNSIVSTSTTAPKPPATTSTSTLSSANTLAGYYGLGIPKSPSFHSGLDQLADNNDDLYVKRPQLPTANGSSHDNNPHSLYSGSGSGSSIIRLPTTNHGIRFKFTNIEETKLEKFLIGEVRNYDCVLPAMPHHQQADIQANAAATTQAMTANINTLVSTVTTAPIGTGIVSAAVASIYNSTNISSSTYTFNSNNATSTHSSSNTSPYSSFLVPSSSPSTSASSGASTIVAGGLPSGGVGVDAGAATNSINTVIVTTSSTTTTSSSLVATLTQHFSAATSASTSLLSTAATSSLTTNNKV